MSRPLSAYIDLAALRANLAQVRRAAPQSKVIAMVKANAYGHGLVDVAQALAGADMLAVACLEEALCLRKAGVTQPIVLLEGFFQAEELPLLAEHGLHTVIHAPHQAAQLCQARLPRPLSVWVKIDTGMHRLGFAPAQFAAVWAQLRASAQVEKLSVMTHLACADEPDSPMTAQQYQLFMNTIADCPAPRSVANSAGILAWPQTHLDWVRPGIMLYGASPFAERGGAELGLQPVMHLHSRLISVKTCRSGDSVGYGASWRCPENLRLGVVAAGYGDGYPRHAPSGTPVWVKGRVVPLVGRVSMDMLTVDLRSLPDAQVDDPVTLWGPGLPVETVARHAGTIAYELLTGVTPRVARWSVPLKTS